MLGYSLRTSTQSELTCSSPCCIASNARACSLCPFTYYRQVVLLCLNYVSSLKSWWTVIVLTCTATGGYNPYGSPGLFGAQNKAGLGSAVEWVHEVHVQYSLTSLSFVTKESGQFYSKLTVCCRASRVTVWVGLSPLMLRCTLECSTMFKKQTINNMLIVV